MSWNYRVIKSKPYIYPDGFVEYSYDICEVYYSKKGKIKGWTDPVRPGGANPDELKGDLKYMKKALKMPVLMEVKKNGKVKLVEDQT